MTQWQDPALCNRHVSQPLGQGPPQRGRQPSLPKHSSALPQQGSRGGHFPREPGSALHGSLRVRLVKVLSRSLKHSHAILPSWAALLDLPFPGAPQTLPLGWPFPNMSMTVLGLSLQSGTQGAPPAPCQLSVVHPSLGYPCTWPLAFSEPTARSVLVIKGEWDGRARTPLSGTAQYRATLGGPGPGAWPDPLTISKLSFRINSSCLSHGPS